MNCSAQCVQYASQRCKVAHWRSLISPELTKISCLILRLTVLIQVLPPIRKLGSLKAGQSSFRVVGSAVTQSRGIEFGEISSMQEAEEEQLEPFYNLLQKMANLELIT